MSRRRASRAGFTLLEVMIALAILGAALVVLLRLATSDVRASHRARMLTIATGLARAKMLDMEELLAKNGFQDTGEEEEGDFSDEGQPKFTWHAQIQKVELPPMGQPGDDGASPERTPPPSPTDEKNQEQLLGLAGGSESGALGASLVQLYFPLIAPVLENAIRKVTLEVKWSVGGESESLKVIAFFTDPKAIDEAARAFGAASGAIPSTVGGSVPPTTGGPSTGERQ